MGYTWTVRVDDEVIAPKGPLPEKRGAFMSLRDILWEEGTLIIPASYVVSINEEVTGRQEEPWPFSFDPSEVIGSVAGRPKVRMVPANERGLVEHLLSVSDNLEVGVTHGGEALGVVLIRDVPPSL